VEEAGVLIDPHCIDPWSLGFKTWQHRVGVVGLSFSINTAAIITMIKMTTMILVFFFLIRVVRL
jgi:hypothetical protein